MAIDTFFGFDSGNPDDRLWITRILAHKDCKSTGVSVDLIKRVKKSKVGRIFVMPLANAITAGQAYSAQDLAAILGTGWTAKKVAAKLNVMGRPEKRFGSRIFERPAPGEYTLTQLMKEAILDPNN